MTQPQGKGKIDGFLGQSPSWGTIRSRVGKILEALDNNQVPSRYIVETSQKPGGQKIAGGLWANPLSTYAIGVRDFSDSNGQMSATGSGLLPASSPALPIRIVTARISSTYMSNISGVTSIGTTWKTVQLNTPIKKQDGTGFSISFELPSSDFGTVGTIGFFDDQDRLIAVSNATGGAVTKTVGTKFNFNITVGGLTQKEASGILCAGGNEVRGYQEFLFGDKFRGTFEDGFTVDNASRNIGRAQDGEYWEYVGTLIPFNVTAGTVPSEPNYKKVDLTAGFGMSMGKHEQDLEKRAAYMTLAEAQASDLKVGQYVRLTDRGLGLFMVSPSDVAVNGFWTIRMDNGRVLEYVKEDYVSIEHMGAVEDTDLTTNSRDALQAAIDYSEGTILVPEKRYRIVGNWYLYGKRSLVGRSWKSNLYVDTQAGQGENNNAYIAPLGLNSFGGNTHPWEGVMENLQFEASPLCTFYRLHFAFAVEDGLIRNCFYNLENQTIQGFALNGPIESGANANWTTDTIMLNRLRMTQNLVKAAHTHDGSEGFGLSEFDVCILDNNKIYGIGDDPIALHNCRVGVARDNYVESIDGRVLVDHVVHGQVVNNVCKRIPDSGGTWYAGNFIMSEMSSSLATRHANEHLLVQGNTMILPAGGLVNYWMRFRFNQKSLTVKDNVLVNDSGSDAGATVSVEVATKTGWTGPVGNPDFSQGGKVRVREVHIENNRDAGEYSSTGITLVGSSNDYLSEPYIGKNKCNSYNIAQTSAHFDINNVTTVDGIKGVSPDACKDPIREVFTFEDLDNTYLSTGKLLGSDVRKVTRAREDMRLMGIYTTLNQAGTGGQIIFAEVRANGNPIYSWNFAADTTTNERSTINIDGVGVSAGQRLDVRYWCSSGQTVAVEGSSELILMKADNS